MRRPYGGFGAICRLGKVRDRSRRVSQFVKEDDQSQKRRGISNHERSYHRILLRPCISLVLSRKQPVARDCGRPRRGHRSRHRRLRPDVLRRGHGSTAGEACLCARPIAWWSFAAGAHGGTCRWCRSPDTIAARSRNRTNGWRRSWSPRPGRPARIPSLWPTPSVGHFGPKNDSRSPVPSCCRSRRRTGSTARRSWPRRRHRRRPASTRARPNGRSREVSSECRSTFSGTSPSGARDRLEMLEAALVSVKLRLPPVRRLCVRARRCEDRVGRRCQPSFGPCLRRDSRCPIAPTPIRPAELRGGTGAARVRSRGGRHVARLLAFAKPASRLMSGSSGARRMRPPSSPG